ncbi:hypothetical protein PPERSA_09855 [Pseudocohnilembus persalinus]|uniref:Uncharacterized protein n=1 Tax=Pseudocohnilembus persalinus TaxID=266149 RepID=A0A0V0QTJ4_PSEPJ|nr:hypothetical protein PPERSA_09855 [Pseudocohnilembus persalinus]|eukprot:KRX05715.1 hypothetical protein PPERSA_09855 [Pseudocohnilembus persalinus]
MEQEFNQDFDELNGNEFEQPSNLMLNKKIDNQYQQPVQVKQEKQDNQNTSLKFSSIRKIYQYEQEITQNDEQQMQIKGQEHQINEKFVAKQLDQIYQLTYEPQTDQQQRDFENRKNQNLIQIYLLKQNGVLNGLQMLGKVDNKLELDTSAIEKLKPNLLHKNLIVKLIQVTQDDGLQLKQIYFNDEFNHEEINDKKTNLIKKIKAYKQKIFEEIIFKQLKLYVDDTLPRDRNNIMLINNTSQGLIKHRIPTQDEIQANSNPQYENYCQFIDVYQRLTSQFLCCQNQSVFYHYALEVKTILAKQFLKDISKDKLQINEIPHLTGEKIASSNLLSILFFWEILLQFIEFFEGIKRHKNPMYEREQKANQLLENERKKQNNQNSKFIQKINIDQQILEYLQDIKQNHFKKSKQRVYKSERHQIIEQLQKKEQAYQIQLESYQAELNKENLQINQNLKQNNEYLKSKIRQEEVQTKELGEKIKVHNLSKYKQQSQILNFVINKAKKEDQFLDVVKNNGKQKKEYNEYVGEKLERQKEKKIMEKIEELSETLRENFKLQKSAYNQNFIQKKIAFNSNSQLIKKLQQDDFHSKNDKSLVKEIVKLEENKIKVKQKQKTDELYSQKIKNNKQIIHGFYPMNHKAVKQPEYTSIFD